jgi:hypothetical protein
VTDTAWVPQVLGGVNGRASIFFKEGKKNEMPFFDFSIEPV